MILYAALALAVVNLVTIFRFWQDKQRAIAGERRIPESDLLGLAFLGGSPGALLARQMFRHKTRKQPFTNHLHLILAAQVGGLISLTFF